MGIRTKKHYCFFPSAFFFIYEFFRSFSFSSSESFHVLFYSSSSGIKDLKWTELAKSSSTFKKAKLTASQSPPEDDEIVPDSQPIS